VKHAAATVAAQAKINLFLHVLAQERSGYHQIETLFCRLMLADDVTVRLAPGWSVACEGAQLGPPEDNLALRAARRYAEMRGWPAGCHIEITKRIPIGGGLGGGSADAGAVLRALRALDTDPPPLFTVAAWGASLGADVPVMTLEDPLVLGWGRGDRLLPLTPAPPRAVLLALPGVAVSTRDAYEWLAASREASPGAGGRVVTLEQLESWEALVPLARNDFEPVIFRQRPAVGAAAAWLSRGTDIALTRMTGSGSTIFAIGHAGTDPVVPAGAPAGVSWVRTSTADHVVEVRRIV
jgi:4-diphosphocytidyl-2-C-methyl-D-erythritol kinase